MRSSVWSPNDGISVLIRRVRNPSSLSLPYEDTMRGQLSSINQEDGLHQEPDLAGTLILNLQASEL